MAEERPQRKSRLNSSVARGQQIERSCAQYLKRRGLKLIAANYRCRGGEIDLIMREPETIVFVEVRFRSSDIFGSAAESVTRVKQIKIGLAARHYMRRRGTDLSAAYRFDVLAVSPSGSSEKGLKIDWIKGAFQLDSFS